MAHLRNIVWLSLLFVGGVGCPPDVADGPAGTSTGAAGGTTTAPTTDGGAAGNGASTALEPTGAASTETSADPGAGETTAASSDAATSSSDTGTSTGEGSLPTYPNGIGVVLRLVTGYQVPVSGALVTLEGRIEYSDSQGLVHFDELESKLRTVARVWADGFAPATAVFPANPEGLQRSATVTLLHNASPIKFMAEAGIDHLTADGRVRLQIPPNSIITYQDPSLPKVTGEVELTITLLDPTQQLAASPGPLEALDDQGESRQLESVMMAEVTVWHQGIPAGLAYGTTAHLDLVIPPAHPRHAEWEAELKNEGTPLIPAWWYDLDAGLWRQDPAHYGTVVKKGADLVWSADLGHFTWWNADVPWTEKECLLVTVVDDLNVKKAAVPVTLEGVNYPGFYTDYTNLDGQACLEMPKGETAKLYVGVPGSPDLQTVQIVQGSDQASACGLQDCQEKVIKYNGVICEPNGSFRNCSDVPAKVWQTLEGLSLGGDHVCEAPRETCINGAWGACSWSLPTEEVPGDKKDNDCDGFFDEDESDACVPFEKRVCMEVPVQKTLYPKSKCTLGTQECGAKVWKKCVGNTPPDPVETPYNGIDDNCNGQVDEIFLAEWGAPVYGDPVKTNDLSDGTQMVTAVAVAPGGAIYIAGTFTKSITLDKKIMPANNPQAKNMFIAQLDTDGNVVEFRVLQNGFDLWPQALTHDPQGNVYLSGDCNGLLGFDGGKSLACKANETFVVRFNGGSFADVAWVLGAGDDQPGQVSLGGGLLGRGLAYAPAAGNVLLAGSYRQAVWSNVPKNATATDIFLGQITKDGAFGSFVTQTTQDEQAIWRVGIDAAKQELVVIGDFFGQMYPDKEKYKSKPSAQARHGFLARLGVGDPATPACTYYFGQEGADGYTGLKLPRALAVVDDGSQTVFVAGRFTDTLEIKEQSYEACPDNDPACDMQALFIAQFTGCAPTWVEVMRDSLPASYGERSLHVVADTALAVQVAGDFRGVLAGSKSVLPGLGNDAVTDGFLLRVRDGAGYLDPVEASIALGSSQHDAISALGLLPAPDARLLVGVQHSASVQVPVLPAFKHHGASDGLLLSIVK